ncbi:UNVERIFIED_CONTAM: CLIP-associating protein 1 [Gekko kuhli]
MRVGNKKAHGILYLILFYIWFILLYRTYVLLVLVDRMGDAKDQVREQAQNLALKLMDQAALPMYIWDRLAAGFKHKNYRSREGVCLCLIATLNNYGAQSLVLSKLVPHLCNLFGDSNSQVRDAAILAIVEIYRHIGEKVRADLNKRGIPSARNAACSIPFLLRVLLPYPLSAVSKKDGLWWLTAGAASVPDN